MQQEQEHPLRTPCNVCNGTVGYIVETGHQDVVRCTHCDAFQYNAPRTETGKKKRTTDTVHDGMKASQRARILVRDHARCVVCGAKSTESELHVGHWLSVVDGLDLGIGLTEQQLNSDDNLAVHCARCNLGQGRKTLPLWLVVGIVMARTKAGAADA